jgi:hypothetical protein
VQFPMLFWLGNISGWSSIFLLSSETWIGFSEAAVQDRPAVNFSWWTS